MVWVRMMEGQVMINVVQEVRLRMARERDVSMRLSWQGSSRIVVVLYDMRYESGCSLGAYILLGNKEGDGNLESPYNFILESSFTITYLVSCVDSMN